MFVVHIINYPIDRVVLFHTFLHVHVADEIWSITTTNVVALLLKAVQLAVESRHVLKNESEYRPTNNIFLSMVFRMDASNMSSLIDLKSTV